jgi:hypothetical protein
MTEVLSRRRLNRATLARQHLLDRVRVRAIDTIEHLGGMQAQAPLSPYVGLWTRLRDFAPDELSRLTEDRAVVRLHMMRNTVHLVSARDCLNWRALFTRLLTGDLESHFGRNLEGVDRDELLTQTKRLLDERPRTRGELGRILAESRPNADAIALAYGAVHLLVLCQVPPRGVWGKSGQATWAPVEKYLGAKLRTTASADALDDIVLRYLGAFGPATVADVQLWSGLTRLREVVERLPLRTFRGEDGEVLYDLPDAPLPPENVPAPPRFLPEYDNLLLSHKDRRRVIMDDRPVPLPPGNGAKGGTFLVDGMWQGTWHIKDQTLHIQPHNELPGADLDALLDEAKRLCHFIAPHTEHDIEVTPSRTVTPMERNG